LKNIIYPSNEARIGIATTYGRPYYKFVKALNSLKIQYDSLLPEEIETYSGNLVLTTFKEAPKSSEKLMLHEEIMDKEPGVIRGLMIQKLEADLEKNELVLGIDPGHRTGLSVYYFGKEIEKSIFMSVEVLVMHVANILAELKAERKIVKIGNGNMKLANEIINLINLRYCSNFELEIVDERKTSLKIKNYNQRGKRDMMSAKYITQREGYRHSILPLSRTG
jgi:hypothetical protein